MTPEEARKVLHSGCTCRSEGTCVVCRAYGYLIASPALGVLGAVEKAQAAIERQSDDSRS